MALPLDGIRVLDVTIWQQGPMASAILADLGADVIKVEGPDRPDPGRGFLMNETLGLSPYFEAHNRNKRAIAIDVVAPEGKAAFLKLVASADVLLHNNRDGVMKRLGLDYESLREVNPRLIYAWASGYGEKGGDAGLRAFDILAQARGGLMSVTGEPDDPPLPAGVPLADQVGAMMCAIGVLAALQHRERTGEGQRVTSSLLGSQLAMQAFNISNTLFSGAVPQRRPRAGPTALWNVYQGSDGRHFALGMLQGVYWPEFARAIGRPELLEDDRFASFRDRLVNAAALMAILDEHFEAKPAAHWVRLLCEHDLLAAPVQDYADVAADPQVLANGYVAPVERDGAEPVRMVNLGLQFSATPVGVRRLSPEFGEHTEAVLLELGYTWEEIESLRRAGVIGVRQAAEGSPSP